MAIIVPIVSTFDSKGIKKAVSEIKKAEGGFNKFSKSAQIIGASFKDTGQTLTRNLTVPIVGLGAVAVKSFADFDSALTQSTAIMGNVSEETRDKMSAAAREVAKNLGMSHKAAAESYYFLASAGLNAEQSIAALPAVAAFAKAGMFDMALATDLATDAQSALGLTSKDATENLTGLKRVTDVLVKANTLANASVEQFSTALTNKAGAAIKAVGKDIEEGVAVLAAFADQGIKGEYAGTQLAIVMRDLQTASLKNTAAFKANGVAVYDANGDMRNMADIVGELEKSLAGATDKQKKMTLASMGFTDKSQGALLALLGTSDKIRQYEKDLRSAGGTTDDVANKQMKSFSEQVNILKSELTDLAIDVGPTLIESFVKPLMGFLKNLTVMWSGLSPEVQKNIVKFIGIVAIVGPLLILLGSLIGALANLAAAIKVVGIVLQFLTMNPIGAVILAIAALIAIIVIVIKNWDDIKEAASNAWEKIKEIVGSAKDFIVEKFKALGQFIIDNHPLLILLRAVKEFAPTVINWFKNLGSEIMNGLRDGIISAASRALDAIRDTVTAGVNIAKNLLKIRSPSKVFASIGENVVAGYIQGIDSMSSQLQNTVGDMAMNSTVAFSGASVPTSMGSSSSATRTYNINVNAGMGTNGAQVGKEIVDAIKRFEKSSGPVFASA